MILEQAREVLKIEARSILALAKRIGPDFERGIEMILASKGRVIVTGIGKSGLVGRKIAATLNSTGTLSVFLHPAEAIHGDLGMVSSTDVILAISNSGRTSEINTILPILREMGAKIIGLIGRPDSPMAGFCHVVIDVGVEREACPMGLAPTASTTATLAMGDAIAVVLLSRRHFKQEDFRRFHPGGSLGERLATKVREIMFVGDNLPVVKDQSLVEEALNEINNKGIGACLVVSEDMSLEGIITDGDIRRAVLDTPFIHKKKACEIMSPRPKTIDENQTMAEALALMELHEITHLAILDRMGKVKGIVHLHDILGREAFRLNGGFQFAAGSDCGTNNTV
jgi:arabinose-5-phosphate isomerase